MDGVYVDRFRMAPLRCHVCGIRIPTILGTRYDFLRAAGNGIVDQQVLVFGFDLGHTLGLCSRSIDLSPSAPALIV
jgi:hypothetical protein